MAALRDEFWAKYVPWVNQFNDANVNLRAVRCLPTNSSYVAPEPDMLSAAEKADLIVAGIATDVVFDANTWTSVTFEVHQSVLGSTPPEITIAMSGRPEPYPDWDSFVMACDENAPLLLPGDRAVLFLEYDEVTKSYWVQSFSGHYLVGSDGKLSALEDNPFASAVNGKAVDEFLGEVERALATP